jgi:hypothetical protein
LHLLPAVLHLVPAPMHDAPRRCQTLRRLGSTSIPCFVQKRCFARCHTLGCGGSCAPAPARASQPPPPPLAVAAVALLAWRAERRRRRRLARRRAELRRLRAASAAIENCGRIIVVVWTSIAQRASAWAKLSRDASLLTNRADTRA